MRALTKYLRWTIVSVLSVVTVLVLYFVSGETYFYVTKSPERAEAEARRVFLDICARERFDPKAFRGPERPIIESDKERGYYTFSWSKSAEETIWITISYLPYDVSYTISQALTESRPTPR